MCRCGVESRFFYGQCRKNCLSYQKKLPIKLLMMLLTRTKKSQITAQMQHVEQIESQLKMAGAVQRDFLPRRLPDSEKLSFSAVFMPADWVSGDIYDVARLDENHIGFYLADAVGHSIPAALLTIFIKQSIQMRETIGNQYKIFSPLEVIRNLNKRMAEQQLSGCQFATCCYCLLNTETLEMRFCRAGHPYPLLVDRQGSITQLQSRGALLGVFENAEFDEITVQLEPGKKIILYSDGADPLIEKPCDEDNFVFQPSDEFVQMANKDAKTLAGDFEKYAAMKKDSIEETDDISMVTLEIL